ncbi:MAG TPA: prepilin-type N-terminal cleavage/methylation domain-containing protein, partial [Candidatus Woesebacteria bacterium]|nr:prepilin-type N-terminal cleavage/methylation domain-containing protein [Candidatus Woesebacteria bacterium]
MKKGFTLLELVVMVAVIAIIMTIITAIMTNTFKANNRTMALQKINDNGSYALEQIRRYYLSQSICDGTALTIDA